MNDNTAETTSETSSHQLVHWTRVIDRLVRERVADAFADEQPARHEGARARASEVAHELRDRIQNLVSPEDYATTIASLEAIARGLGWDETAAEFSRGIGHRGMRGFDPRAMRGFGPHLRHGFAPAFGRGRSFRPGPAPERGSGRPESAADAESSYERGFEAGLRAAKHV